MTKKSIFFFTLLGLYLGIATIRPTMAKPQNLIIKGISKRCAYKLLDATLVYSALSQTDFESLPLRTVKALKAPYPASLIENNANFFQYAYNKIKSHSKRKIVAVSYFFNSQAPQTSVTYYFLVRPTLLGCKVDPENAHQHFY